MKIIKLMADYGCYPLWDASPGVIGNINPDDLPISDDLKQSLMSWAHEFDAIINWSDPASSAFPSTTAEQAFINKREELAEKLRTQLGSGYTIVVWRPK
jgi:hypothetical protein